VVGWKYVDAKEAAQKYKIGKFILETKRVVGGKSWEEVPDNAELIEDLDCIVEVLKGQDEAVEFDSEDDNECEELFAGIWDAEVVAKRKLKKSGDRRRDENNA